MLERDEKTAGPVNPDGRSQAGRSADRGGTRTEAKTKDQAFSQAAKKKQVTPSLGGIPFYWREPYRLWTLWDMLDAYAHGFCRYQHRLQRLTNVLSQRQYRARLLPDRQWNWVVQEMRTLELWAKVLNLRSTVAKINRVISANNRKAGDLSRDLGELVEICLDELESEKFLYLTPIKADIYKFALLDWHRILERVAPSAISDGEHGDQCYALGQPTASVYHFMRVMNVLVNLLAIRLAVSLTTRDGREKTWGQLTTEMEHKVNAFAPDNAAKERRQFYTQAVAHLSAANIAWRGDTMHPKAEYTDAEALEILQHVKTFARHFCEGYDKHT
ncbi:MAG TPA: hypothetical protein VEJ41_10660 [Candidatus Acidoferrales bacterium]|nr:hypothetical protein [Candidatus Acidoferrales bacterium]